MYIYANSQTCPPKSAAGGRRRIIAQHDGDHTASRFFYLHDRLGSVRQLIDNSGTMDVVHRYTYDPFGELFDDETEETTISNPFKFTGQYFDDEIIDEYYLRARQYNPHIGRFTSRDPVKGKFEEPLTLHKYLYCQNDPINRIDPEGRIAKRLLSPIATGYALYFHTIDLATYAVSPENWKFLDLAVATAEFMPYGIGIASLASVSVGGNLYTHAIGTGAGLSIEHFLHITGMGLPEGLMIDFYAYYVYANIILNVRAESGIRQGEMEDFIEWNK